MKTIYQPKGQAREYGEWAANPYRGCGHKCAYCYVPAVLHMPRADFDAGAVLRDGFIEGFEKDAARMQKNGQSVNIFFCFTTDMYNPSALWSNSTYHHARLANISGNKRHQLKKSKCEMCGTSKGLRVHHIVPVSWGGVQFAPDRIYTVCKTCHGILHQRLKAVLTNDLKIRYFSAFSNEIIRLAESTIY